MWYVFRFGWRREMSLSVRAPILLQSQTLQSYYYLEITDETTELPVSDLSPWSKQIKITVMLSQQFFPYL